MTYKIVVADHSPSALKAAEMALGGPEFEVHAFADGLEAIEAIRDIRPDAVLVGLSLPSRDGYDVASFVRADEGGRQTALFYLRGLFEPLDAGKIAQGTYDGIVQKPFDGETLSGLLREAIDRKKELPSLPEEPALEPPAAPPSSAGDAALPVPAGARLGPDLEARIRIIVRQEIKRHGEEFRTEIEEIVSAEFKKMLVEELKNIDTRKI